MALGYGQILSGLLGGGGGPGGPPATMPPTPPGGSFAPHPGPTGPPFRIGGPNNSGLPSWLQDKIAAFNSLHMGAVGPTAGGLTTPGAGAGYQSGAPHSPLHQVGGGGQAFPGPIVNPGPNPAPPTNTPPDWQTYWQNWYAQRQPYADWLGGYVRGAY